MDQTTQTQAVNPWNDRAMARHRRVWRFLQLFVRPFILALFRLKMEPLPDCDGPRLILCSHSSMLDPVFLGAASRSHFYFVTSESLLQKGLRSWALNRYFGPVSRQKGTVAAGTVMQMLRLLRQGCSICLFPEGIASPNGEMVPPMVSAAKLAKSCRATLVNYRFDGAYLSKPKWAAHRRRGPIFGVVAGVYSPEALSAMKVDEIQQCVCRDLGYNDYLWQEQHRIPYPCARGLAEGLENVLYLCPGCGQIGTLHAGKHRLACACGFETALDEYGFFTAGPYKTVLDWDRWQTEELNRRLADGTCRTLTVQGATLYSVSGHRPLELYTGTMTMDREALTLGSYRFPLADIRGLNIHGRNYLVFFVGQTHYEIKTLKTKARYSAYPFLTMFNAFSPSAGQKAI